MSYIPSGHADGSTLGKRASDPIYWANQTPDIVAREIIQRADKYYYYILTSGRLETYNRSHRLHHQGIMDYGRIRFGGVAGEQTLLKVNHLRNITRHVVNLISSQRPAFDAKAANSDYDSEAQCQFAQALLDHDLREKRLERVARQALDYAVKYGEGYATKVWNANAGPVVAVDPATGHPIHAGALEFKSLMPSEIIRDYSADDIRRNDWYIVRTWVSRYELLARYDPELEPERYDAVLSAPGKIETIAIHPMIGILQGGPGVSFDFRIFENSDEIEVLELWHARTHAVPQGRRTTIVNGVVLDDGPLPYDRVPVFRIAAGNQDGVSYGYTQVFDSLPIQHMINSLYAAAATNNAAFGIQSILRPIGQVVSVRQLATGMQEIQYDHTLPAPAPLQMTQTAPETYKFLELLVQDMQTNLGVNDVIRGVPQTSLKSGAALAMVASQALQFMVDIQAEYVYFLEDLATASIEDYKRFADLPQVITIAGKSRRSYSKSFTKEDLQGVSRVSVDIGNPLSRTIAGRMEMAQQLQGMSPEEKADFVEVMSTGRLDVEVEGDLAEDMLIRSENEALADIPADGSEPKPVIVLATDLHARHVRRHKELLASSDARLDPGVQQRALEHINEHIAQLQELSVSNPLLLTMVGEQVAPPVNGPGAAAEPVQPPGGPVPTQAVGPAGAGMPQMPQLPKNPQTGERVQAPVPGVPTPGVKPR